MKHHADINEVMPTATQRRAAQRKARDAAYVSVETAIASLDDAKRHFAFLEDDVLYQDCGMAMAMAEDLKDSMDGGDEAA